MKSHANMIFNDAFVAYRRMYLCEILHKHFLVQDKKKYHKSRKDISKKNRKAKSRMDPHSLIPKLI